MSSANNSFSSSFPICVSPTSSSCLVAVARNASTVLKRSGERGFVSCSFQFCSVLFSSRISTWFPLIIDISLLTILYLEKLLSYFPLFL